MVPYCTVIIAVQSPADDDGESGLGVVGAQVLLQFQDAVDNAEPHFVT